jgi:hypothetical protein
MKEARMLDLDDVRWELGRFGKLNVRHGKGSRRKGPKPRLVQLINCADRKCPQGPRWPAPCWRALPPPAKSDQLR